MNDNKITVHICDKRDSKPLGREISGISSKILQFKETLTIEEFANKLSKDGMTTVLAAYSEIYRKSTPKKDYEIQGQQIVALDFDNKDLLQYDLNDLENDEFFKENASFMYKTFSDSESEVDKFRVVIQLDRVVEDKEVIEAIYSKLLDMYPAADSTVRYSARMIFGSNRGYEEINFNNRLNVNSFLEGFEQKNTKKRTPTSAKSKSSAISIRNLDELIITENSPVWQLLKFKKLELAKVKLDDLIDLKSKIFPNRSSFKNYLDGEIDMKYLLELPSENTFIDIFHDESEPSATVFESDKTGNHLYKCHSKSYSFTGGTSLVISKLLNKGLLDALDAMADLLDVKIAVDSNVKRVIEETEMLVTMLRSEDLDIELPNTYTIFGKDLDVVTAFLGILNENLYEDFETQTVYLANFYSLNRLAEKITHQVNYKVSNSRLHKIIVTMAITGMVTKLTDSEIPAPLLKTLNAKKKLDGHRHHTDVYLNEGFDADYPEYLESITDKLASGGYRKKAVSYDFFVRLLGSEFEGLKRAYAQKNDTEIGKTSAKTDAYLDKAVKFVSKWINKRGYVTEKQLTVYLAGTNKVSFEDASYRVGQLKVDLVNAYGFERIRMNKAIKGQFDTSKDKFVTPTGYPVIYVK